jgi:hypothetical protein
MQSDHPAIPLNGGIPDQLIQERKIPLITDPWLVLQGIAIPRPARTLH